MNAPLGLTWIWEHETGQLVAAYMGCTAEVWNSRLSGGCNYRLRLSDGSVVVKAVGFSLDWAIRQAEEDLCDWLWAQEVPFKHKFEGWLWLPKESVWSLRLGEYTVKLLIASSKWKYEIRGRHDAVIAKSGYVYGLAGAAERAEKALVKLLAADAKERV